MRNDLPYLLFVLRAVAQEPSLAGLYQAELASLASLIESTSSTDAPEAWKHTLTGAITPFEPADVDSGEWRAMVFA